MEESRIEFLQNLKRYGVRENIPNISFDTGEILQFFVRVSGAKRIFEIGCANGFSTIFLADAVAEVGGRMVTCDVSEPSFGAAQDNVAQVGLGEYVEFRFGDGLGVLGDGEEFDLVFIDGQKSRTHEFFVLAKDHLSASGIIIIDDTTKFPEKMASFHRLRNEETEFCFFDIPVDGDDSLTVAFNRIPKFSLPK